MTILNKIIEFEAGDLTNEETLELFSELLKSGQAWSLQGLYGRMANDLIEKGLLSKNGEIHWGRYYDLINGIEVNTI